MVSLGVIDNGDHRRRHRRLLPASGLILEREEGSLLIDARYLPEHAEALLK